MLYTRKTLVVALTTFNLWLSGTVAHEEHEKPTTPTCTVVTTTLVPQLFTDLHSVRVKVNYGPFTVPSRSSQHHGMRNFKCAPLPPCRDCVLTWMHATLEYADGSDANADTGMWLHHTVWQNTKRGDAMCSSQKKRGERFFASGNERTPIDLTSNGLNRFGYLLTSEDAVRFAFEAMNMQEGERDVSLAVTWEYIPQPPEDFRHVKPYWLDVTGCGNSEVPAQLDAVFSFSSAPVKAPTSGVAAMVIGHLHDGGTHLQVTREGRPFCVTRAVYENGHINQITRCDNLAYSRGDEFSITAHYNTSKHVPMAHPDGELEPVMGIALIYAVQDSPQEGERKHRKKRKHHLGKHVSIGVFSTVFVATLFAVWWIRSRKTTGQRIVTPAWLRLEYLKNKWGAVNNYQTIGDGTYPVGYRD